MIRRSCGNVKQKSVIPHKESGGDRVKAFKLQRAEERVRRENPAGADAAAVYTVRSGGKGTGERRDLGAGVHQPN